MCGRTVSPCPHAHSTSGLSLHVGREENNSIPPFLHYFHPHAKTVASFSSCTGWDSSLLSSRNKLGSRFSAILDFPVKEPFMISAEGVCFHTNFVVCVYVFPCPRWDSNHLFYSSYVFPVVSVLRSGLLFSPRFVVWCGFFFILVCCGYYWVVLAMIEPRTTQESDFLIQAMNHFFKTFVCM